MAVRRCPAVFLGTFGLIPLVGDTAWSQSAFNYKGVSFFTGYLSIRTDTLTGAVVRYAIG